MGSTRQSSLDSPLFNRPRPHEAKTRAVSNQNGNGRSHRSLVKISCLMSHGHHFHGSLLGPAEDKKKVFCLISEKIVLEIASASRSLVRLTWRREGRN